MGRGFNFYRDRCLSTGGLELARVILDWNQYFAWDARSSSGSYKGSFSYHFTAMGTEVVSVPFGSFDAMRIDAALMLKWALFRR